VIQITIAKISNLTKEFKEITAVNSVTLRIYRNEILAILGPSGCGKSTLLQLFAGLEKPDTGSIVINDELVYSGEKNVFISPDKRRIALVFQNYALWPHYNVFDNIAYPLKIKKEKKTIIEDKVKRVLSLVKLDNTEERFPEELSGGEQQRVALARALIMEPEILLLDEPLSNLDAKLREEMQYEIKRIQEKMELTIVHVTHDQNEAMGLANRIAVMKNGEIIQEGKPEEIYRYPCNQFVANFIGKINVIDGDFISNFAGNGKIDRKKQKNIISENNRYFVRPEEIRLDIEEGLVKGQIVERRYLGNLIEYKLQANNQVLIAQTDPAKKYQVNDEIYIDFI
jgi:iron(III) transport system ATP-binding protein